METPVMPFKSQRNNTFNTTWTLLLLEAVLWGKKPWELTCETKNLALTSLFHFLLLFFPSSLSHGEAFLCFLIYGYLSNSSSKIRQSFNSLVFPPIFSFIFCVITPLWILFVASFIRCVRCFVKYLAVCYFENLLAASLILGSDDNHFISWCSVSLTVKMAN